MVGRNGRVREEPGEVFGEWLRGGGRLRVDALPDDVLARRVLGLHRGGRGIDRRAALEEACGELGAGHILEEALSRARTPSQSSPWSSTSEGVHAPSNLKTDVDAGAQNGKLSGPFRGLVVMSQIKPRRVRWLWESRIALGENTVLDGDPGLGKTMLLCDLIGRVTTGRDMPDGKPNPFGGEPRGVVVLNAEDSLDTSLAPRLVAVGADMGLVGVVVGVPATDGDVLFPELLRDLSWIKRAVEHLGAAMVIVDPLVGFLGDAKEISANSDQDMRRVLNPFGALMRELQTAGVTVRHLRKASGGATLYRGSGSIAISATARGGLLIARDPHDRSKHRRILAVQKSNLAEEAPPLAFRVTRNEDGPCVEWLGPADITTEELLAEPSAPGDLADVDDARDFLEDFLDETGVLMKEILAEARKYQIKERTLRTARLQMGVTKEAGCVFKKGDRGWAWRLPTGYRGQYREENQRAGGRSAT